MPGARFRVAQARQPCGAESGPPRKGTFGQRRPPSGGAAQPGWGRLPPPMPASRRRAAGGPSIPFRGAAIPGVPPPGNVFFVEQP